MRARTVAGLGLALLCGGIVFAIPSLYPAAVTLLLLPAIAWLWVRLAAVGAAVEREPPPAPLIEGHAYPLRWRLRRRLVPPPGGELRDPLLSEPIPIGLSRQPRSLDGEARFERRGRIRLGAPELVLRDPFRLHERRLRGSEAGEVVVLPRIEPLQTPQRGAGGRSLGAGERGAGGAGPDSWAAEFEIDGLRRYREGSPAARIHWPTVARTGELHERRITGGADAARLVVLDPMRPAAESDLDAAVRAAASICHELGAAGGCVLLIGGEAGAIEVDPRQRNFAAARHRLALVEADAGLPRARGLGRAGVVFWVTADPSRRPESGLSRLAASRRILVRPDHQGAGSGSPPLFRVADCEAREHGRAGRGRRPDASGIAA